MWQRLVLGVALAAMVGGCGESPAPAPTLPSAPRASRPQPTRRIRRQLRGVFVTRDNVLLDGRSLGFAPERLLDDRDALGERVRALHAAAVPLAFEGAAPASAVLAALRAIEEAGVTDVRVSVMYEREDLDPVCDLVAPPERTPAVTQEPTYAELSIELESAGWTAGIVQLHELRRLAEIRFGPTMHEYKSSALFVDRDDAELAAGPNVLGGELARAITGLCPSFPALRPLEVRELATHR